MTTGRGPARYTPGGDEAVCHDQRSDGKNGMKQAKHHQQSGPQKYADHRDCEFRFESERREGNRGTLGGLVGALIWFIRPEAWRFGGELAEFGIFVLLVTVFSLAGVAIAWLVAKS